MSLAIACANPFRPADWRWQRAIEISEGLGPNSTRRRDHPQGFYWIRRAVAFKRALDNAGENEILRQEVSEQYHDVFWAHWLWDQQINQRRSVEAHILARESDFDIGRRVGLDPKVVTAFESIFFNVREKLPHSKYILYTVMGPSIHSALSDADPHILFKLYGYYLGPHVLDAIEDLFANPMWVDDPVQVRSALQDDAINSLKLKAALAAKTVGINRYTQLSLIDQFTKFVEIERLTDSAGQAQAQVLDTIESLMQSMPLNVGGRDPRRENQMVDRGPLAPFDKSGVELNYEETIRVSLQQPVPGLANLQTLAFPRQIAVLPAPPPPPPQPQP